MRKLTAAPGLALAMSALATSAAAAADSKAFQLKLMATSVDVDGAITRVGRDEIGLPANADTRVSDSWVPTVAAEYFITPRVSVETICCVTQHDVEGAGSLNGAALIDDVEVIPATITLKYNFPLRGGVPMSGSDRRTSSCSARAWEQARELWARQTSNSPTSLAWRCRPVSTFRCRTGASASAWM